MAMIFELGLPQDDLSRISAFMQPGYDGDIPELTEIGSKVLDRVTGPQRGLWHVVVGRFVEYDHLGERRYRTPEGELVTYADALMDEEGHSSGRWGRVIEDY